jgi:hypothetical protein
LQELQELQELQDLLLLVEKPYVERVNIFVYA